MGSKLAVAAQVALLLLVAAPLARAESSDDLVKQGADSYSAGKYDDAISAFTRAYAIDHKKETLYALAQAERLGGHCPAALAHYKQLLALLTDLDSARMIESNVALCERTEAVTGKPASDAAPPKDKPSARVEHRRDPLAAVLGIGGAIAIGAGIGLYVASDQAYSDAKTAGTLGAHNSLDGRADVERVSSYAAMGVGAALVGYAIYRWTRGHGGERATVSFAPVRSGTLLSASWRW